MLKTPLKTLLDTLINHFTKERLETLIIGHDEKLLTFMLEHENADDYKNAFFKIIANALVFNEKALSECLEKYLEIKELDRFFTRFKNKIGLFSQGGLIKSSELVVLNFPFKDNVLLGNAKDNSTKPNELFYHEILHKKEIDTLLNKKALCHFEMHGQGDLESALKDRNTNYLIKGNNLIALHSLKKKFAKQVKCIYIDPPYNTGNDSFNYNDNFNHSSWLVFMKNRLEAAREFLSDDGVIFVQCDDNEQAYLKVLMDEIFLRENFVGCIIRQTRSGGGFGTSDIGITHDYVLVYAKNRQNFTLNKIDKDTKELTKYFNFKDEKGSFHKRELKQSETQAGSREDRPLMFYPILAKKDKVKFITKDEFARIYNKETRIFNDDFLNTLKQKYNDFDFILPIKNDKNFGRWTCGFDSFLMMLENNEIMVENSKIYKKEYLQNERSSKVVPFLFNETNLFNGVGTQEIKALFANSNTDLFSTPKPEALISRILEISTQENDLVLDFFAGSGTTCAVAHKMKRRYIGIEQMDYIETITKERLKKVIEGEQGGISKKCGFKGGGSFVYAELKEVNLEIKRQITNANSASECLKIFNDLSERFLKRADGKMDAIHSEEFQKLDLNEQKRKCCDLLDSNEDYLNLGDIDEDAWGIDGITKKYNEIFYS
ncbi:DNA methyltransferase [Helicobacter pylori]